MNKNKVAMIATGLTALRLRWLALILFDFPGHPGSDSQAAAKTSQMALY